MMNFWKRANRGYMDIVEPLNACWLYLFSCEWRLSLNDMLVAYLMFMALVLFSPFAYLCVAPVAALLKGAREEEEE